MSYSLALIWFALNGILTAGIFSIYFGGKKKLVPCSLYQMSCVELITGDILKTLPHWTTLQFDPNMSFQQESKEKKYIYIFASFLVHPLLPQV